MVIDFNPAIYEKLMAKTMVLFGDITDPEILEAGNIRRAKMIISTVSSNNDNMFLLNFVKKNNASIPTIIIASSKAEAIKYYKHGASLVIVPFEVAGDHIKALLRHYGVESKKFKKIGKNQFSRLTAKEI